jgi:hypothetical protein
MNALHAVFLLTLLMSGFFVLQTTDMWAKTTNHPFKLKKARNR